MSYQSTALYSEAKSIMEGSLQDYPLCAITLFNDDIEYTLSEVLTVDDIRNYAEDFQSILEVVLTCPAGDYQDIVVKNKRNLKARLTIKRGLVSTTRAFKAYLLEENEGEQTGNRSQSNEELNQKDTAEFALQLMDPIAVSLAGQYVAGNILRDATAVDAIRLAYGAAGELAGTLDGNTLKGVDVAPYMDGEVFPTFSVMHTPIHERLTNLCHILQKDPTYGIYPSGLSQYYERGYVYIFPTYFPGRAVTEPKTLMALSVPGDQVPISDVTYTESGGAVKVLITENAQIKDGSEIDLMLTGNAIRSVNAESLFVKPGLVENGSMELDAVNHNTSSLAFRRDDELVIIRKHHPYISKNQCVKTSEIARASGKLLTVEWINSNSDLLYPGMPVVYRYYGEETDKVEYGVLHHAHVFMSSTSRMSSEKRFVETTRLSIFLGNGLI